MRRAAPPTFRHISRSRSHAAPRTAQRSGGGSSKAGRRRSSLFAALAALLVTGLLTVTAGPASAGTGLTPDRRCKNFITGDGTYRLSVCSRGFTSAGAVRGVVEMHTYVWDPFTPGNWDDSTSQSVTLNQAYQARNYGADFGGTCRVNGAAGRVACSVPNTARVAFYGPSTPITSSLVENWVWSVSWRDAQGAAHYVDSAHLTRPDTVPFYFGWLV